MSPADTTEPETIGHMLTRFRILVEDGGDWEPVRGEIIARFEALEQERDAAVESREREAVGRIAEAQRAADLGAEVQRVIEHRDAAEATIATLRCGGLPRSAQTQQLKTMLAEMGLLAQIGKDYGRPHREIIAHFVALEQERDALRERLSSLADTKNPLADELQSVKADLAAARAEVAQLTEQLQQAKEDHAYMDKHAQTYFDESQFMRDLILCAMRGER